MGRIVCKFGGTSCASAEQFGKIKSILSSNKKRTVVVVSAPGKRNSEESKVTDLLIGCYELAQKKLDFVPFYNQIVERFESLKKELGLSLDLTKHLDELKTIVKGGKKKDLLLSRGEYICGIIMADFLGAIFIDPKDHIILHNQGRIDPVSYTNLATALADESAIYVIPGFYGRDVKGPVKTFSRGGSDITGAIAARAIKADVYENWTDVSGLMMADPRIVQNPKAMEVVTYSEIRELAYMGANVFHDEAIAPVRDVKIPIQIKNTNRPDDAGTLIVGEASKKGEIVAGIAGKRKACIFNIEKTMMNKEKGFGRKVLGIFESHDISYELSPTGIDTMSVVLLEEELGENAESLIETLNRVMQPDKVTHSMDLSLIAVVGEGMRDHIGTAAAVFNALMEASVNVKIIDQGSSELNIIVGVKRDDYETAIKALYEKFINHPLV